ncbi:MAG: hypothetical protein GKR87_03175 [Kiritimatiellae bacterium]|nr:hypothetical protein [Kiritimatiellia bacterium]
MPYAVESKTLAGRDWSSILVNGNDPTIGKINWDKIDINPLADIFADNLQGFANFDDSLAWRTFDPGDNGVGVDPDGYIGGVYDGRYIYFVPNNNGTERHGEVLRHDTQGPFTDTSSWEAFDPGINGVGTDPDGFRGGVYDGRYIYFMPRHNGAEHHGEVLCHDTQGPFTDTNSWQTFDPGLNGIGVDPDGYIGGVYGRYIYFVPNNNGTEHHREVLRHDTQGIFTDTNSWQTFDPGLNGVGTDSDGYIGGVYDGRYIYFVPFRNQPDYHGEVLRYDTRRFPYQQVPSTVYGGSFF